MPFETGSLIEALGGRVWNPGELRRQWRARALRLAAGGVRPGDRVLLLADNTLEFFAELLAVWSAGAAAIPADASLSSFEFSNLIAAAEPRLAVRTGSNPSGWEASLPLVDGREFPEPESAAAAPAGLALDGDALILFTSGSTGRPKGVVHTHRSLLAQWCRLRQALGTEPYRRTLCLLPVFFGHGLICNALFPLLSGCDLFLGPAFSGAVLARLGRMVDQHSITSMSSVPALWRLALRLSGPPAGGSLVRVHCGSAPLSAALWRQVAEWSGGARVINTYGITETASWIGGSLDGEPADGLIGRAWGGDIRVLRSPDAPDFSEAACGPGQTGYVWVRTPALMKAYFRREDLTGAAVRNGWFYTGDIGFFDEEGRVYLSGRAVDEINKGGLKIQPQDVENVAAAFPRVRDVCVFPVDDELFGQNVGIAVVMDGGGTEALAALNLWMRERLSRHKLPAAWYVLDSLPRTSRGKIHRPTIAALCAQRPPLEPGLLPR